MAKDKQDSPSLEQVQAEARAARERLGHSAGDLAHRTSPAELKRRATDSVQAQARSVVKDEDEQWRFDRLSAVLAGVSGVALLFGGLRRVFYRG